MDVRLECNKQFDSKEWICPGCKYTPLHRKGVYMLAPLLSKENDGFKEEYFERLIPLEEGNFWFNARNKLLAWIIGKYFSNAKTFLEIGCGTGFVLSHIEKKFPDLSLYGSEVFAKGLEVASRRVSRAVLLQMDAANIPFADEFDLIGAFDVLEHIEDDKEVLKEMYKALKRGGGIILTVPQHKFLWSSIDEFSHHYRRYSSSELIEKVKQCGFEIVRVTSFVSLLMPMFVLSRLRFQSKDKKNDNVSEFKIGYLTNLILGLMLDFERFIIKLGVNFPFGSSLLLIAYKDGE